MGFCTIGKREEQFVALINNDKGIDGKGIEEVVKLFAVQQVADGAGLAGADHNDFVAFNFKIFVLYAVGKSKKRLIVGRFDVHKLAKLYRCDEC